MKAKRVKPRRTFNPIRLQDGSLKRAEYRVGVDLRRLAAGRPCMVRLPGCDGGGATTVLAHFRMGTGAGIKPADWLGAWACFSCHNLCDGRTKPYWVTKRHSFTIDSGNVTENGAAVRVDCRDEIRTSHAEGVFRTLAKLIEEGVIKVGI